MSGYAIADTRTTITDTPDHITSSIPGVLPAAGIPADLVGATKNVAVRIAVLRATCVGAADTYSVHRLAIGDTTSTANAIAKDLPIENGETQALDNIILNAGDKVVVISGGGRVSFSADIGEEP
jgi:hypothetical protein